MSQEDLSIGAIKGKKNKGSEALSAQWASRIQQYSQLGAAGGQDDKSVGAAGAAAAAGGGGPQESTALSAEAQGVNAVQGAGATDTGNQLSSNLMDAFSGISTDTSNSSERSSSKDDAGRVGGSEAASGLGASSNSGTSKVEESSSNKAVAGVEAAGAAAQPAIGGNNEAAGAQTVPEVGSTQKSKNIS